MYGRAGRALAVVAVFAAAVNPGMESFIATLKTELIHHHDFHNREEARQAIFEYIEVFYNRQRVQDDPKSELDFQSSISNFYHLKGGVVELPPFLEYN